MASSAGFLLEAGRIPGEWIDGVQITSDSSSFTTTEVVVATLADVGLVDGRTYDVIADVAFRSDADDDLVLARLREDNLTGTAFQRDYVEIAGAGGTTRGFKVQLRGVYTATSTGLKTFVVTADRLVGSGNCTLKAAADHPSSIDVFYRSG